MKDLTIVETRGGKRVRAGRRTCLGMQGIDLFTRAGHRGILGHLCPSAWKHAAAIVGRTARGGRLVRQA